MGKYFINVNTLEALRRQYKDLLKRFHPDNGGDEETMKAINAEYDKLFKALKDRHESKSADSRQDNTKTADTRAYDWEGDQALRDILQKVIGFTGIDIEIVGSWIWISGNTYAYKSELKDIGFKWASQKKMWYWHGEGYVKISRKVLSMDSIRGFYGSVKVDTRQTVALEA